MSQPSSLLMFPEFSLVKKKSLLLPQALRHSVLKSAPSNSQSSEANSPPPTSPTHTSSTPAPSSHLPTVPESSRRWPSVSQSSSLSSPVTTKARTESLAVINSKSQSKPTLESKSQMKLLITTMVSTSLSTRLIKNALLTSLSCSRMIRTRWSHWEDHHTVQASALQLSMMQTTWPVTPFPNMLQKWLNNHKHGWGSQAMLLTLRTRTLLKLNNYSQLSIQSNKSTTKAMLWCFNSINLKRPLTSSPQRTSQRSHRSSRARSFSTTGTTSRS